MGGDITFLKTNTTNDWKVQMLDAEIGDTKVDFQGEHRYAMFELGFPFVYIPMADFNRIADVINMKVGDAKCVKNHGKCFFS